MSLVTRLIVCRVKIVYPTFKTGIHYGQVLVREGHIDDKVRLMAAEKLNELLHTVGIDSVC